MTFIFYFALIDPSLWFGCIISRIQITGFAPGRVIHSAPVGVVVQCHVVWKASFGLYSAFSFVHAMYAFNSAVLATMLNAPRALLDRSMLASDCSSFSLSRLPFDHLIEFSAPRNIRWMVNTRIQFCVCVDPLILNRRINLLITIFWCLGRIYYII